MTDRSLSHLDPFSGTRMVDVSPKEATHRRALARCKVAMKPETTAKAVSYTHLDVYKRQPEILKRIDAVATDFAMTPGTCGKDGQSVPVGCGQATMRLTGVTIGGTAE